jgi:hypothetical protein
MVSAEILHEGPGRMAAPALLYALIHPSAWNWNSRKFGCSILHRSCLSGRVFTIPLRPEAF